jgi:hypothetical protein
MRTRHYCFPILIFAIALLSQSRGQAQLYMETIDVYAVDTIPKQTQFLPAQKRFEFICSGTFSFWRTLQGDSIGLVDAAYYRDIPPGEFGFPGLSTSVTNGFLINGQPISGRINPPGVSPTYTYRVPFTGLGAPATLFIEDRPPFSIDRHADNTGMIRVDLYNVSPEIDIDTSAIDFGEVELGDYRDTVISFKNIGYGPLRVENPRITGSEADQYILTAQSSWALAPGDSASLSIRFAPQSVFRKNAQLELSTNDSDVPLIVIRLTGVGVTTLAAGFSDTVYARAQEFVEIPVLLTQNRSGSLATTFAMDVEYDPHLLYPIGWTTDGTLTQGHNVSVDISRPGEILIRDIGGTALAGTGVLLKLRCIGLWHEPNAAPITVRSLTFNAGNPRSLARSGILVVDSMCNQYLKTVSFSNAPQLRHNHPNPFNPSTVISFQLPDAQHIRLDIHGIDGRHITTLVNGILREGNHDVTFLASGLPSGVYVYTLQSASGFQSRSMLLLR